MMSCHWNKEGEEEILSTIAGGSGNTAKGFGVTGDEIKITQKQKEAVDN